MDYDVCMRCNLPYEDIDNLPHCPECVELYKTANDEKLIES